MGGGRIIGAAQLVPVSDLAGSVAFCTGRLCFAEVIRADDAAGVTVRRESGKLGLQGSAVAALVRAMGEVPATQTGCAA